MSLYSIFIHTNFPIGRDLNPTGIRVLDDVAVGNYAIGKLNAACPLLACNQLTQSTCKSATCSESGARYNMKVVSSLEARFAWCHAKFGVILLLTVRPIVAWTWSWPLSTSFDHMPLEADRLKALSSFIPISYKCIRFPQYHQATIGERVPMLTKNGKKVKRNFCFDLIFFLSDQFFATSQTVQTDDSFIFVKSEQDSPVRCNCSIEPKSQDVLKARRK